MIFLHIYCPYFKIMATKLEKTLIRYIEEANEEWKLFKKGERLIVGVSGGKDSLSCLRLLSFFDLHLKAVHINLFGKGVSGLKEYCSFYADYQEIKAVPISNKRIQKNPCYRCSRERRQLLLEAAAAFNCHKIALGHHKDDAAETLIINMIYSREISTMMPLQVLFKGTYMIIRPMYLIPEPMILSYAREQGIPELDAGCEFGEDSKRRRVKEQLAQLNTESKGIDVIENVFSSMKQIKHGFIPFDKKNADHSIK